MPVRLNDQQREQVIENSAYDKGYKDGYRDAKQALSADFRGTSTVLGNLAPGETVIIQKRGKHGNFEPKKKWRKIK
jgi:dihydrodipicolinate synthase/N-acetylneuraminate lyase